MPLDEIFCDEEAACGSAGMGGTDAGGGAGAGGGSTGGSGSADGGRTEVDAEPRDGFQVFYATSETDDPSKRIRMDVRIINHGSQDIPLSRLELRYHFTAEGHTPTFQCNFISSSAPPRDCDNLLPRFQRLAAARPGADHYLAIGFNSESGSVAAYGGDTGLMKVAIHPTESGSFMQSDDYSFDPGNAEPHLWPRVTLYLDGALVFGQEP